MTGFGFVCLTENDDYVAKKFFSVPKTKRSSGTWAGFGFVVMPLFCCLLYAVPPLCSCLPKKGP